MFLLREHQRDTRQVQSLHAASAVDVALDEANLIADAGLVGRASLARKRAETTT
jgi:hypothetical protein